MRMFLIVFNQLADLRFLRSHNLLAETIYCCFGSFLPSKVQKVQIFPKNIIFPFF